MVVGIFVFPHQGIDGKALTFGTMLDNIPESVTLGISLLSGASRDLLMLVGIVLNNFPESISSTGGVLRQGFTKKQVFTLWGFSAILIVAISVLGFIYLL